MKRINIIAWMLILWQPCFLLADYTMMCTFWDNPVSRVYTLSDEGNILFKYNVTVGGYPLSICFAPNGKWGLVGGDTIPGHPDRQITTILGVDENYYVSVLGSVYNDQYELVTISPDSKYGIYGADLKSLRMNGDYSFYCIPTSNPIIANFEASFSRLNNKFYFNQTQFDVREGILLPDGKTTETENIINIYPFYTKMDIKVSPDGRTCVVLGFNISVFRIHENEGFTLVQQFDPISYNPRVVDFTPDSQFAILSFINSSHEDMKSYRIGDDSRLTEVGAVYLPYDPGEDMAVTPDGKFAVTRALIGGQSFLYVVRIHKNGTLEYFPQNDYVCNGHVSCIAFVPPQKTEVESSWNCYE